MPTLFWTTDDNADGARCDMLNPGQPPVSAIARSLGSAAPGSIPLTALEPIPEATLIGRASLSGTGEASPQAAPAVAAIRRFPTVVTEAVGGALNNVVLGEIDSWRFTATSVVSGVVAPVPALGREFVMENAAALGSGITVTVLQESGLSATSRRFNLPEGIAQIVLQPHQMLRWRYVQDNRWRVVGVGGQLLGNASVGASQLNGGVLSALTSTSPTATNATTNIGLATLAIPANTLVVGHTYRSVIYYSFVHTAAATPTLTFDMLIGGVVVATLVVNVVSTAGTFPGFIEGVWRFTAVGAGGNAVVSFRSANNAGFAIADFLASTNVSVVPVDTTLATSVLMRMRMTTAVAANTITINQAILERLINV
jgi:hypothetical protein